jgi:thioesterase domain-containing protein
MQAMQQYAPRPYSGPITLFKASEQLSDVRQDLGWGDLAAGGLVVRTAPGNHYSMLREPHIQVLAGLLEKEVFLRSDDSRI